MRACITGSPVDEDGVCVEHGETACVVELSSADSEMAGGVPEADETPRRSAD